MNNYGIAVLPILLITGCASSLKIYDSNNQKAKGVPISAPQLVEVTTTATYKVAKGREQFKDFCTPEVSSTVDVLPLGERFYVNFDPAKFGDGEFAVEFNDKGLVKSITLNSKASAGAEQANTLLSTILPFVKSPKAAPEVASLVTGNDVAQKLKDENCLKDSTKVTSIKKIEVQ